jgi:uncharacterized membrane protein YoaK (UPF0700 family)
MGRDHGQLIARREERSLVTWMFLLTGVSGLVDAFSYLQLGHVFVANMTGNIVFVGFALAGASGLSAVSSAVAVASFFVGALVAGRLARSVQFGPAGLLRAMAAAEVVLVLIGIGIAFLPTPAGSPTAYIIIALLAVAMGIQSATTTRLGIPGFNSTVVLTTMISTLAASSRLAGGSGADNERRILAIGSMLAGGLVGAVLTLRVIRQAPLWLAGLLLLAAALGAHSVAGRVPPNQ